jgi:hypothetical protein
MGFMGPVIHKSHLLHKMFSLILCNNPGGAGTVVGMVAHHIHPTAAVTLIHYVIVFSHGGMILVVRKFANRKLLKIILKKYSLQM